MQHSSPDRDDEPTDKFLPVSFEVYEAEGVRHFLDGIINEEFPRKTLQLTRQLADISGLPPEMLDFSFASLKILETQLRRSMSDYPEACRERILGPLLGYIAELLLRHVGQCRLLMVGSVDINGMEPWIVTSDHKWISFAKPIDRFLDREDYSLAGSVRSVLALRSSDPPPGFQQSEEGAI